MQEKELKNACLVSINLENFGFKFRAFFSTTLFFREEIAKCFYGEYLLICTHIVYCIL